MTDIVLFGVQGAGKGTQAQNIVESFPNFALFETGSIFRALSTLNNRVGEFVRQINQGKYIHYSVTNAVFDLMIPMLDEKQHILFDGYPRNLPQLFHLLDFEYKHHRKLVGIYLKLDDKKAMQRLMGRRYYRKDNMLYLIKDDQELDLVKQQGYEIITREDDHPDAIRKRIDQYHGETEPIIEYMRTQDMLVEVDADQAPQKVFEDVRKIIKLSS
ncbi:MAG: nucleoside monophosphate kinase [Candidatus Absconditabacterales bacterium]